VGGWDEEDERRLMLLQMESAAIKALDSRPTLKQEQQLLQHAVKQQQSGGGSSSQQQQGSSSSFRDAARQDQQQRQQLQHQMFDKLAGIAGQLSLTGDRQAIRQQVSKRAECAVYAYTHECGRNRCAARVSSPQGHSSQQLSRWSDWLHGHLSAAPF
jgi:hypothetical protein